MLIHSQLTLDLGVISVACKKYVILLAKLTKLRGAIEKESSSTGHPGGY